MFWSDIIMISARLSKNGKRQVGVYTPTKQRELSGLRQLSSIITFCLLEASR